MKRLFWIFLLSPLISLAQFTDDFSDGNFTANPVWTGDDAKFEVDGNQQLHLNAPAVTETAYLTTPSGVIDDATWEFWVMLDFNPSSSNEARVYVVSNQQDISGPLSGYFVNIGGTNDDISLYKQDNNTLTKIIDGPDDFTDTDPVNVRVRLTRSAAGLWELYADTSGGSNFVLQGDTIENSYTQSFHFGVYCEYTSTRSDKFYFDDFMVSGSVFVDSILPEVVSVGATSANQVDVVFSEPVSASTANNASNYSADGGLGNPASASIDGGDPTKVHLTFGTAFNQGDVYNLSVSGVQDLSGNTMNSSQHPFAFYIAQLYDVVFNEIMADPSPVVAMPNREYFELFNRTQVPINVKDWLFSYGSTTKSMPDVTIPANGYLAFTTEDGVPDFGVFLTVAGVEGMSSTALTNGGQTLTLRDSTGNLIHSVTYSTDWYQDALKDEGGWSLEQIDPNNPCGGMENWRACENNVGGTPSEQNSIFGSNPDNAAPEVVRVTITNDQSIVVWFNENLDSAYAANPLNYSINNGIGNPTSAIPQGPLFDKVNLSLASALQLGTTYELTVSDTVRDCVGNLVSANNTSVFAIPEWPEANDIVINELLHNPYENGVDFVEIYNRSAKVIDLKDVRLANYDTIASMPSNVKVIAEEGFLMFPEDYLVLTTSEEKVTNYYTTSNTKGFVLMSSLPSFNNDDGTVSITDSLNGILDYLVYDADMHFALLGDLDGVSLERLSPERPSTDRTNWHSAAEDAGFATPGEQNSQFNLTVIEENPITIDPEVFSPDNDGYQDVLNINYEFDQPGYVANISIYDGRGRLIRQLFENELLGTTGTLSWDGINEDREKSRIGIYIVYFEVFDTAGNVKKYKNSCVLGGKL